MKILSQPIRNFILVFLTEEMYPSGSQISFKISVVNDTFKIELNDIMIPKVSKFMSDMAYAVIDFNETNEGYYFIKITINNKTIIGMITVSDQEYNLKLQPNNIIFTVYEKRYRIPQKVPLGDSWIQHTRILSIIFRFT